MTRSAIRDGIRAYLLCTRDLGMDYMPINPEAINYALQMIGKTMSINSIK